MLECGVGTSFGASLCFCYFEERRIGPRQHSVPSCESDGTPIPSLLALKWTYALPNKVGKWHGVSCSTAHGDHESLSARKLAAFRGRDSSHRSIQFKQMIARAES